MADYKTLYHKLYNRITDVLEELQQVQQETEDLYADGHETEIELLKVVKNTENQIKIALNNLLA